MNIDEKVGISSIAVSVSGRRDGDTDFISWTVQPKDGLLSSKDAELISFELLKRLSVDILLSTFAKGHLPATALKEVSQQIVQKYNAILEKKGT
jgi:hypothetical protein